jgi:hypothetical protein
MYFCSQILLVCRTDLGLSGGVPLRAEAAGRAHYRRTRRGSAEPKYGMVSAAGREAGRVACSVELGRRRWAPPLPAST